MPPELEAAPPTHLEVKVEEAVPLHEAISVILKDGRTLSARDIAKISSERKGKVVTLATVYSALVRHREMFEKTSKGYRLRHQKAE